MIRSSHVLVEELRRHYESSEDCRYLFDRFQNFYYLLHKGAFRRLRRYQWKNGLTLEQAVEILKEEIDDYQIFRQTSLEAWNLPTVKESYQKDPDPLLQFADRLYAREILEVPDPTLAKTTRRIVLGLLRRVSRLRFI